MVKQEYYATQPNHPLRQPRLINPLIHLAKLRIAQRGLRSGKTDIAPVYLKVIRVLPTPRG